MGTERIELMMKVISLAVLVIVLGSFILMVFGMIPGLHFWIIMIIGAVMAYKVIPRLRKSIEEKKR
ncbi:hypothetical protein COV93_05305 [Candidatus Woesearchaeota archaeon CG11_big_fil_rev_8_21_14_0_20_43_8]|nr:MAG: hypothetical protein COV93_05305 [Candidatus Woesearchaeota archaeon CG11_big_fil_rev_8_21_14_0_20_43_8]PIO07067.1 MAG: hypothetical protein COT47_01675 [Candidatus Woesearchaeota archaeon CG08_land_8_20_14_0_20_43_7]